MKIGVLSDTHGNVQGIQQAINTLNQLGVSLLIHCGDIGTETIPAFRGMHAHFVPGNIDDPKQLRQIIIDPQHTLHDPIGVLEIEGRRVAFLHGHDVKAASQYDSLRRVGPRLPRTYARLLQQHGRQDAGGQSGRTVANQSALSGCC